MSDKIEFENHYSARVLIIIFPNGYKIENDDDLQNLKNSYLCRRQKNAKNVRWTDL